MTPINRERIIRASLRAIVEGEGTIDARMETVAGLLEKLSATDRRLIVKTLKMKLARALRQKTATLRMAGAIDAGTQARLKKLSEERGMLFIEELEMPQLLAGFSLQMGDDRTDYSLKGRVEQLV
jgi:F0F1-type ATP synthase delta subunit